jgi:hypothetical protein
MLIDMATFGAAIRTALVNDSITGVGTKIYRDLAPPGTAYPYMTYVDQMSDSISMRGDGKVLTRRYMMQFDIWQKRPDEDQAIIDEVSALLEQIELTNTDKQNFECRLTDIQRIVEFDDDIVHHALTLDIYHKV